MDCWCCVFTKVPDNVETKYAVRTLHMTAYTLTHVLAELSLQLQSRDVWVRRDDNTLADMLANREFQEFSVELRVHVELETFDFLSCALPQRVAKSCSSSQHAFAMRPENASAREEAQQRDVHEGGSCSACATPLHGDIVHTRDTVASTDDWQAANTPRIVYLRDVEACLRNWAARRKVYMTLMTNGGDESVACSGKTHPVAFDAELYWPVHFACTPQLLRIRLPAFCCAVTSSV